MFNKLRTGLNLLSPNRKAIYRSNDNIKNFALKQKENQKKFYKGSKTNNFKVNNNVIVKDYLIPVTIKNYWQANFFG